MDAENTDRLIAGAIAALPYRKPSAGFGAKVMTAVAAAEAPRSWQENLVTAAGLTVTVWMAGIVFVSAKLIYGNLGEIATLIIRPGGIMRALDLAVAHAALGVAKLASAASFAAELLSAAAPGLPAWYETAAAALLCAAAIAALSGGRASAHKAGIR
jgi:hypothetical protein